VARAHPQLCRRLLSDRPLLAHAASGNSAELENALAVEENAERERDKAYWTPRRKELEKLRHGKIRSRPSHNH
jgi:hypothetical protein